MATSEYTIIRGDRGRELKLRCSSQKRLMLFAV